jgi:hypothetical protein
MVHASLMGFCHLNEFSAATAIERGRLKVVFNIRRACLRQLAICLVVLAQFSAIRSYAQQAARPRDRPLTLDQAIDFALANYPAVRASLERAAASREGVSLSRTAYLPRTDLLWQSNRATRNNIFGLLLPQSAVPPISGPVLSSTADRGVWESAAGILRAGNPPRAVTVNVRGQIAPMRETLSNLAIGLALAILVIDADQRLNTHRP